MPEISLLQPTVLNGVIEELPVDEELQGIRLLPRIDNPEPTVRYDIVRGSRLVATPNVPNSEAHIVPKLGVAQMTAGYFYVREKKVFEPTTMYWLRAPGSLAARNAEAAVLREAEDLVGRVDRFIEYTIWRGMFTGTISINEPDVKANVDFGIASSHKPVLLTTDKWDYVDAAQPVGQQYTAPVRDQINAWKRLTSRDGMAQLTDAWLNNTTMEMLLRNRLFHGDEMSDRLRDAFFGNGDLPVARWMGINWHEYDLGYEAGGTITPFIPDGYVVFYAGGGRPFELRNGPCADFDAGPNRTGRFTKTWQEPDPSARQMLVEHTFFPTLYRPDQIVYAKVF